MFLSGLWQRYRKLLKALFTTAQSSPFPHFNEAPLRLGSGCPIFNKGLQRTVSMHTDILDAVAFYEVIRFQVRPPVGLQMQTSYTVSLRKLGVTLQVH